LTTCVSPIQSAEGPKDVNKVMAQFDSGWVFITGED
jgi:hypothetical protein